LHVQLDPDAPPVFSATRRDLDAAFASLATIVAVAQIDGGWARLKACPGHACGWAFYDHSRNQNSSWCSMSVCGSRAKAREYRKRRR
jgi:predicted RNA-binding Zn ribbon-like protein